MSHDRSLGLGRFLDASLRSVDRMVKAEHYQLDAAAESTCLCLPTLKNTLNDDSDVYLRVYHRAIRYTGYQMPLMHHSLVDLDT